MAVNTLTDINLGKLAQIIFSDGVRSQLSKNYADFEMIKLNKSSQPAGARSIRFMFQDSYGPARVQWRNAGTSAFPAPSEVSVAEYEAHFKELDASIRISYNLWKRLQKNPKKYAENLALEMESTQIAIKRMLASAIHDDGTGVLATISSASVSSGVVTFNINPAYNVRGSIGRIEFGDLLLVKAADTTARTPTVSSGTFYAYKVTGKTRSDTAPAFTAVAVNSAGTQLTATDVGSAVSTDVIYRVGQPTFADLTAITSSVDYGTLTDVMAGLPTLISADNRKCHGINFTGSSSATVSDLGGSVVVDVGHIHSLMDSIMINVGQGEYNYSQVLSAPEAIKAFIDSRETDRRFNSVEDSTRGTRKFVYQHYNNSLEMKSSEFIPTRSMYILPDPSKGDKSVLEFLFEDMELVKPSAGASGFQLEANSAGYNRAVVAYMEGYMTLINKRPGACGKLTGFTLS